MKNKIIILITIFLMAQIIPGFAKNEEDGLLKDSGLKIYIPRQTQVKKDLVTLGDICAIRGEDSLVEKAVLIEVGKFSIPGQSICLSRSMVLGRLASNGFSANELEITGAQKIEITKKSNLIKAEQFIKTAKSYLKNNMPSESIQNMIHVGHVEDYQLPDNVGYFELVPSLMDSIALNKAKINISIISDEQIIKTQPVEFQFGYEAKKIIATRNIRRGEALSSENIKITKKISNRNQSEKLQEPYGLIARRAIRTGNVITDGMVDSPEKKVVIKRNDNVAVVINKNGLFMQAIGKSIEDGRIGDYIKVRMQVSSVSRVIYAQVQPDGTVEPLM